MPLQDCPAIKVKFCADCCNYVFTFCDAAFCGHCGTRFLNSFRDKFVCLCFYTGNPCPHGKHNPAMTDEQMEQYTSAVLQHLLDST
tara:strand:- start:887 stop:1144 length:258 start_codon:yes stop_codon:yes gene_type:complete